MPVLYLLLVAAAYGSCCTLYDLYRALQRSPGSGPPDFPPPQDGAKVRVPKTPLSGGAAEVEVEVDGSSVSQVP